MWSKLKSWIPRPFKALQRALDIQKQWASFKQNMRPHRFKVVALGAVVTYPLYKQFLHAQIDWAKDKLRTKTQENVLDPQKPIPKLAQIFVKNLVDSILMDNNIRNEASKFVNDLSKRQKVQEGVLGLLLNTLQTETFLDEVRALGQKIVVENASDKQVEGALKQLILRVLRTQQVKHEVTQVITVVFSSQAATKVLVQLLSNAVSDQEVRSALSDSVKLAFRDLLNDEETVLQLKIFVEFLLREFEKDADFKQLVGTVVVKGVGMNKSKQDKEIKKLLGLQAMEEDESTNKFSL